MIFMKMTILISSATFLLSNNSLIMICSLILSTIMGTFLMIKTMKMIWMSFMILMLTVGGMMILYVFIISLNSNEKSSFDTNKEMWIVIMIPMMIIMKLKPQTSMENSNFIINLNINMTILFSMMSILMTMMLLSKISVNPFSPSKSIK